MQDSYLLAVNERLLHYRTPTEQGAAGSAIFEPNDWRVAAIQRKGTGETNRLDGIGSYEANASKDARLNPSLIDHLTLELRDEYLSGVWL